MKAISRPYQRTDLTPTAPRLRGRMTARQLDVLDAISTLGYAESRDIVVVCQRQRRGESVDAWTSRTAWLRVSFAPVRLSQTCAQLLTRGAIERGCCSRGAFLIASRTLQRSA